MEKLKGRVHHAYMARRPGHHLRAWRKKCDLTLEAVAEKVKELSAEKRLPNYDGPQLTMTHATLSRIERGQIPYNQHLLEILAEIYQVDEASLIMRDPADPDGLWSIYEGLTAPQRVRVVEIAKTLKRTG
jgi:transcriptional regulator with XRE-family HTH domain